MPTMAKLFSGIMLAALGWYLADLIAAHLPEEILHAKLRPITAVLGLIVGWRFMGKRVGGGWSNAIGFGLSSVVLLAFVGLFTFSLMEMLKRALRKSYDGPIEALEGIFSIGAELAKERLTYPDVILAAIVGGIIAGLIAEFIARRWS